MFPNVNNVPDLKAIVVWSSNIKIKAIEEHLNRDFSTFIPWFVDKKLNLHLAEDKAKSILFSLKHRSKTIGQIDIS